ncbi:DUF6524 family protein [Azospirillum sp. TSO35-2]|uniref:DUF6524 family protein n=1 Tax=Azospirillum sp. TSO35-2 TaxID=716796 RepID=UPI000D60F14A|nr:DUF6524 family protein [Azospirillum sp. TSO35-2]PWC31252.1 hypothetical protein TSO352_31160 [Azospirillum sp. TSO35-2]
MMTTAGFVVRLLFALMLVFGIYNPFGYSYYHWLMSDSGDWTVKLFAGVTIAFLLFIHIQATWRSMKLIGVTLIVLLAGSLVWVLADYDVIDLGDPTVRSMVALSCVAAVLGAGQSWSLIRYRLSGQVDSQSLT